MDDTAKAAAEQAAQLKSVIEEATKPLLDRTAALEADLKTAREQVKALESTVVRKDAEGHAFVWGAAQAPAHLRSERGSESKGLSLTNLWRACMASGGSVASGHALNTYAPEEVAISQRLKAAGYTSESLGGILFPLADELLIEPTDAKGQKTADFETLRKEVKERLRLTADPGEMAWHLRRHPEMAKSLYGFSQKDLQLGDDTLGGFLVPSTQSDRVIDLLRARAALMRAGATEVPLPPSGNISYPRLSSDPTFTYTDPDTTTDSTTSNIGLGVVRLLAKSLRGYVTIPNDLLRYSTPSVELLVRSALASKFAIAEDNNFLENVGSSIAPKGIINYSASTAETPTAGKLTLHVAKTVATNGNTFEVEDVMLNIGLYYAGNDPDAPTAWLMRPIHWSAISNRRADAVSAADGKGPFLFQTSRGDMAGGIPTNLGGFPVVASQNMSANRAKGSGTTLVYTLFGNFRRVLIGRIGTLELAVSEHVKFLQDKTIIRAVGRNDLGMEQESSLVFTDTMLEA